MFTTRAAREESYKVEVRRTYALLKPIQTEAAAIFYPTLFEVDPSTKKFLAFQATYFSAHIAVFSWEVKGVLDLASLQGRDGAHRVLTGPGSPSPSAKRRESGGGQRYGETLGKKVEEDTYLAPLFKDVDMEKQGAKLMKVIGVAVMMLDKMDEFKPMLVKLGKKHVTYGVTDDMYPSVVSALLITLEKGLGEEFHPLTKDAWAWVMNSIAAVCIAAAREDTGAPAGEKKLSIEKNTAAAAVTVAVAVAVGVLVLRK